MDGDKLTKNIHFAENKGKEDIKKNQKILKILQGNIKHIIILSKRILGEKRKGSRKSV